MLDLDLLDDLVEMHMLQRAERTAKLRSEHAATLRARVENEYLVSAADARASELFGADADEKAPVRPRTFFFTS
jgi:hypothetical protein